MKRLLLLVVALCTFTGVAMADSTTATSTTQLNVTVIAPVTLTCDSTISWNVLKAASGNTASSGHLVTCNTGGGAATLTGVNDQLLQWKVSDLTDGGTNTLSAMAIGVSTTSNGTYNTASAANTFATISDNTTTDTTLPGSYTFYVNATIPSGQAAAAYQGNMTVQLTVTYAP